MEDAGNLERIQRVIAETLALTDPDLSRETRVKEDLGADSMQVITIIISLDEEFDTEFDTVDLPKENVTIGWIEDFVARTLASKG